MKSDYNQFDYIIVGSGLTGATIARILFEKGYKVLVVEKRKHLGGNVYDENHVSGIRVHTYGPHYFRTSSDEIWQYVNRFSSFDTYEAELLTEIDGNLEPWPIQAETMDRLIGKNWSSGYTGKDPTNFEEASLSLMPTSIYEKFIKGYSQKQWGINPDKLSASLAKRFDVRFDNDRRLFKHKYQGIPSKGYAKFMENMLAGIPVLLNIDYLKCKEYFIPKKRLIYTGPIDSFFDYKFGKLKYRGQKRVTTYFEDIDQFQPVGQVNNPSLTNGAHIRTLEWKHMMPLCFSSKIKGTVITKEITYTPESVDEYEYPFPDTLNSELFKKYQNEATKYDRILICGRLGEYRYFDMDQAIGRAMTIANKTIEEFIK